MNPLVATALIGTARQSGTIPTTGSPAERLIGALPAAGPERTLLLAAGADAICRQAGQLPGRCATPAPCEPEALPVPTAQVTSLLTALLAGPHAVVLPEALALLARSGRRLPAQLLPALLDTRAPATRSALLPVLGTHGRWLARHNPEWRWALESAPASGDVPPDAEQTWQEGSPVARRAALAAVRVHDPARARDWLAAAWKAEKAEIRHDFLAVFAEGLSPDDEPFLEAALDDRSERVRGLAGSLLARLPDSAFVARMIARADPLVEYRPGKLLRHAMLLLHLPREVDRAWQRDANLPALPAEPSEGDRAQYLGYTLAVTPLAHWTRRFGATPAELVAAGEIHTWQEVLLAGWSRAALAQRDQSWAEPLWEWWRSRDEHRAQPHGPLYKEMIQSLLALLPAPAAEGLLMRALEREGEALQSDTWLELVGSLPRPWSRAFSLACLEGLRSYHKHSHPSTHSYYSFWTQGLEMMALALAPSCFAQALDLLPSPAAHQQPPGSTAVRDWQAQQRHQALGRFAKAIRLRRHIRQELAP